MDDGKAKGDSWKGPILPMLESNETVASSPRRRKGGVDVVTDGLLISKSNMQSDSMPASSTCMADELNNNKKSREKGSSRKKWKKVARQRGKDGNGNIALTKRNIEKVLNEQTIMDIEEQQRSMKIPRIEESKEDDMSMIMAGLVQQSCRAP